MKPMGRMLICLVLGATLSLPAHAAPEDAPSALAMTGDLLIARPVGIAVLAVGTAAFVASLPFSLLGGNTGQAADALVVGPAREAFWRCLGCRSDGRYQDPGKG